MSAWLLPLQHGATRGTQGGLCAHEQEVQGCDPPPPPAGATNQTPPSTQSSSCQSRQPRLGCAPGA